MSKVQKLNQDLELMGVLHPEDKLELLSDRDLCLRIGIDYVVAYDLSQELM